MNHWMRTLIVATLLATGLPLHAQSEKTTAVDPLRGKIINVIGDSYVRNHRRPYQETWHYKVALRHGMTYRNYGRNGSAVAFDRSNRGFGPALCVRYKEMNDTADYVLVIAGHNDAAFVGHSRDTLRIFSQRLQALCAGLRAKYPTAKIGWVTPWGVDRPGFRQVIKTIKKVCPRYGIRVLDASRTSGIRPNDPAFRKRYFQSADDTAHLNADGHNLLVDWGDRFLKGL